MGLQWDLCSEGAEGGPCRVGHKDGVREVCKAACCQALGALKPEEDLEMVFVVERPTASVLSFRVKAKIASPEAAAAVIGRALPVTTLTTSRSLCAARVVGQRGWVLQLLAVKSPWARKRGAQSRWVKSCYESAAATAQRLDWLGVMGGVEL